MIQNGSIEVVTGEESEGFVFGTDTDLGPLDDASMNAEVARVSGAVVGKAEPNDHAAYGCKGVWNGINRDGEPCKISVWELQP